MINKIKEIPMLNKLNQSIIDEMISKHLIIEREYSKNTTLYNQGDICSGIDLVLCGKLIAYALSSNGSETIVFEFNRTSVIGANLLFGQNNRYPMNIYCTKNVGIIHIDIIGIKKLLNYYDFTIEYIKELSNNAQGMNKKIAMYTQKTLRENLLDYLLNLSLQQKSNNIDLPITKKELADYFGVQRPSLFRELKKMKDEGIIEVYNKKIVINKFWDGSFGN